jgi:hypothetical protein
MKSFEWTTLDKTTWGPGPWQTEPDKVQWPDPMTGLPCLAVRHPSMGNWCGYVGVPLSHPDYGRDFADMGPAVHGGVTFAGACQASDDPSHGICHVREPEDPEVWWFGFDCAHWDDYSPGLQARLPESLRMPPDLGVYRDLDFVRAECRDLAQALGVTHG